MARANVIRVDQIQSRVVSLTGGINESVTTMELAPGELLSCSNYAEVSGPYAGYSSCPGYEVFDGTVLASDVAAPLTISDLGVYTWDDTSREARRAAITPVPGEGQCRGVWVYNGATYAVRNATGGATAKLYKSTNSGWSEITGTALNPSGHCRWVNARFSKYPDASAMINQLMLFMVDGVSQPICWDGTTLRVIDHASLPSNASFTPAPVYPTFIGAFENRLFLVYQDQVFFSAIGDADNFGAVDGAGQIPLGDTVTNVILAPGNALVFIMRNSIKILYNVEGNATADFSFQLKEYSSSAGGFADTAARVLNDVYFADDRGPTMLRAVDSFGDFAAQAMTVKAQRTYLGALGLVTAACSSKTNNQYRLFFSNQTALFFTMAGNQVKGTGVMKWPVSVKRVATGEDSTGREVVFFTTTDTDGFVYKMDSGTSFNGEEIVAYFSTAFHHYGSPRNLKHLLAFSFELTGQGGLEVHIRPEFDFGDSYMPNHPYLAPQLSSAGGIWGEGVWGEFIWGGSTIQRPMVYCYGYGTTISVSVRTSSKYVSPHIFHSYIADYSTHERRI